MSQDKKDLSSDEDDVLVDADSCGYGEIQSQFTKFRAVSEVAVSQKSSYVLHLTADSTFGQVAAGTSQNSVEVFKVAEGRLAKVDNIQVDDSDKTVVCGVKFAKDDDNVLYVGSTEGKVSVYDLRKNQRIHTFQDELDDKPIPITCFDTNSNGRVLCAGSERVISDAFLLFFDTRQRKKLGGYCESHEDDITDIRFHPTNPDSLISGSTDGLVNVFDISKDNEDDALSLVINTESSVHKLHWNESENKQYKIACVTHTHDFKLYEAEEGDVVCEFMRADIAESVKRKSVEHCNLINCHSRQDGGIFLLAGSNYTDKALRSVLIDKNDLSPFGNYESNKQIVRDSVYDPKSNILLTGGENAIVSLWNEASTVSSPNSLKMKTKVSLKSHNKKPY
ncbi:WD repeat-containing protein 89 isoform X2 [Hermetia illucens]|uniref:WD repeat-containing protein 89 isoform X2 n=1 Tax=Hermetia illucens TaxID=343691 RepID=UPI0018CC296B|nr:WD repeat-containing protein 89 isoform X2 [Hermetia illucens]